MQAIKENLPAIGIGLAAIAVAGYIAFGGKDKKTENKREPSPGKKNRKDLTASQVRELPEEIVQA